MAIKRPEELSFSDKTFSMIIYGSPGLGKTTLALSAPDPVLIDFDRGVSRVKAYHRKLTIECSTYEEVLNDIQSPEVAECKTIIIDTGGSFVTYLQDWAMRTNPTVNRQKNGALSLKGFGAVKAEFARFTNYIRDVMHKNIIYVFHSDEQKDKDGNPIQRLQCEGAARNLVWQPCDLGGYMQMIGNKRVISFTPEAEFFAKGCYGIEGQRAIAPLAADTANDFLTNLFAEARTNIAEEQTAFEPVKEQYEAVMEQINAIIDSITDAPSATKAAADIPNLPHALTSKKEARAKMSVKVKSLGLVWNAKSKEYQAPEQTPEAEG